MRSKRDIDREWRRLERKEWMDTLVWPLIVLCAIGSMVIVGLQTYPQYFGPVYAFLAAVGIPLCMWMNKKR